MRDEKVKVLRALDPIATDDAIRRNVGARPVRGRAGSSGEQVPGYREEPERRARLARPRPSSRSSSRSTTGAGRMCPSTCAPASGCPSAPPRSRSSSSSPPRRSSARPPPSPEPNLLAMRIQPDEGITLRFAAKVPGRPGRAQREHGLQLRLLVRRPSPGGLRDAAPRRDARRRHAVHARRRGRGGAGASSRRSPRPGTCTTRTHPNATPGQGRVAGSTMTSSASDWASDPAGTWAGGCRPADRANGASLETAVTWRQPSSTSPSRSAGRCAPRASPRRSSKLVRDLGHRREPGRDEAAALDSQEKAAARGLAPARRACARRPARQRARGARPHPDERADAGRGRAGAETAERAMATVSALAARHPSRAIVVSPGDPDGPASFERPHLRRLPGRPRAATPRSAPRRSSSAPAASCPAPLTAVAPLLIHDLPVVLWWPDDPPFGTATFRELAERVLTGCWSTAASSAAPGRAAAGLAAVVQRGRWSSTTSAGCAACSGASCWPAFRPPLLTPELADDPAASASTWHGPAGPMRLARGVQFLGWMSAVLALGRGHAHPRATATPTAPPSIRQARHLAWSSSGHHGASTATSGRPARSLRVDVPRRAPPRHHPRPRHPPGRPPPRHGRLERRAKRSAVQLASTSSTRCPSWPRRCTVPATTAGSSDPRPHRSTDARPCRRRTRHSSPAAADRGWAPARSRRSAGVKLRDGFESAAGISTVAVLLVRSRGPRGSGCRSDRGRGRGADRAPGLNEALAAWPSPASTGAT